jgi:hypothetical protein
MPRLVCGLDPWKGIAIPLFGCTIFIGIAIPLFGCTIFIGIAIP